MNTTTITRHGAGHGFLPASIREFFSRLANGVADYMRRSHTERELESLDDRLLADIGLMRSDIRHLVWGGRGR